MARTDFRPSIHGWPFGNSFNYTLVFDTVSMDMGFCGGMCWTALRRFHAGTCIPPEPTATPTQGDPLYEEILGIQVQSLGGLTLARIFEWQQSPDLSHKWNPHHSIGHKTQQEWPAVRSKIDGGHPVTLTLIASSNDYSPGHLKNNHRVVAYGHDERSLQAEDWVHGERKAGIRKVTLRIYDPNYPGCDDIALSFFTGCEDSWIGMRHSGGDEFHGFFLDDEGRAFAHSHPSAVHIDSCTQTGFVSASLASYDLRLSWRCRVIPFFVIELDGSRWTASQPAFGEIVPKDKDIKQCPAVLGSTTVTLQLPRALTAVAVRLMDADDLVQTVEVDATPAVLCFPYLHTPRTSNMPGVIMDSVVDSDLYIKETNPSAETIRQMDTSPSRWIECGVSGRVNDVRGQRSDLTRAVVAVTDLKRLGNVVVAVLASIVEKNLASPIRTSGVVKTFKGGLLARTVTLPTLRPSDQVVFDGFQENPADYDNDTRVEFTFRAQDCWGVTAVGTAVFYGRSIIHDQSTVVIDVFNPAAVAKIEMAAQRLIELGLLGIANQQPALPPGSDPPWPPHAPTTPGPARRSPANPATFMKKLRADRAIQSEIDLAFRDAWGSASVWQAVWKYQSELVRRPPEDDGAAVSPALRIGGRLASHEHAKASLQRVFDGVALQLVGAHVIDQLCERPGFVDKLRSL